MNYSNIVSYDSRIPNNINLSSDRRVLKSLERWHTGFFQWWNNQIPEQFQKSPVYLRTAVNVDADGWAKFGYVKMPDYRWGILLAPKLEDRVIPFGRHKGEPSWQQVPGEYRALLRRLIIIQGDTEPGSVEQQRLLGLTAPSLYDMRNLFQVNVEEARHLWAMVYLLVKYFGRDGREEAEELLRRTSGSDDTPRLLSAFNEKITDWLSFFMFTYFTDRDGKMQLESLAQSGFDPLSRTCRFMLTEEAHHMFVGENGISRIIEATLNAMQRANIDDPNNVEKIRDLGVIDLPTIQRKMNLHFSLSLDLFGQEVSTNAANAFNAGIKGRYRENRIDDDHQLDNDTYIFQTVNDGVMVTKEVPALTAINIRLRDDYIRDASRGVSRWNRIIKKAGINYELQLPNEGFHRKIGDFAPYFVSPQGNLISEDEWNLRRTDWLPSDGDAEFVDSIMKPCYDAGKYSSWIAPPRAGVNNRPGDFEYVKLHSA